MKKHVFMTAAIALLGFSVANAAIDNEVDSEIDQMYSARQAQQVKPAPTTAQISPNGAQSGQPIYILNQATPTSTAQAQNSTLAVQKQPTTYVEATPLNKSRADQIREARQQVEAETESKIVEKLETSRIEDEKRRANVLFGEKFTEIGTPQTPAPQQPQAVVVAPAPVAVVAPAPAPVQVVDKDIVREEIRTALDEKEKGKHDDQPSKKYFSAIAGVGDYPDVSNVRGNYLLGVSFGSKFDDTYAVEGSFVYSNYTVQKLDGYPTSSYYNGGVLYVPPLVDVNQYTGSLALKYYFLSGMVKPVVGGVAAYSYRTFGWSSENVGGNGYNNGGNNATSQAIDLGVLTGVDFEFSPKFTLGLDFRYMWNMSSRISNGGTSSFLEGASYGTPIEKLQYYNIALAARVAF